MQPKRRGDRHPEAVEGRPAAAAIGAAGHEAAWRGSWPPSGTRWAAFGKGSATESAIKQEVAIACLLVPLSFFVASDLWTWVALIASLFFVLSVEFMNTAIERLCNHIQPGRHEAIRITKDLASAAVFFALALAALVWIAALWARFVSLIG